MDYFLKSRMKTLIYKIAQIIPDKYFLMLKYFKNFGEFPNLSKPHSFNEKINWLKLHTRDPKYTDLVDKYTVKSIVGNIIGFEHIIPTIGAWENANDIDFDSLPEQFVLKTTHGSGDVVVCRDKRKMNFEEAVVKLNNSLKKSLYLETREWPYKNVKKRIIAEQYMVDESCVELKDYKFFCFSGTPRFLFVATGRPLDTRFDFFDIEFNHLPVKQGHPNASKTISMPRNFDEMVEIAKKLSQGFKHVRVDLYNVNGKIYFGELTFFHFSGAVPFEPADWDIKFGEMINLSD